MVKNGSLQCPSCFSELRYYDTVKRIVRTKNRETNYILMRRLRCMGCGKIHREIPEEVFPYKQYEAELIRGVIEGLIFSDTLGYEDYPCELTMIRWRTRDIQVL